MTKSTTPIVSFYNNVKRNLMLIVLMAIATLNVNAQSDACAGATSLAVNTTCVTTGYIITNTFNNDGPSPYCSGTSHRDGWFTFTTGATHTGVTITGTGDRNMGLAIYTGACASLTQVACTNPGTSGATLNATVSPSTLYRLRISRTNNLGSNSMTGTICVVGLTGCSGTPVAGTTASTANPACSGAGFTLSVTSGASGGGITYQWQSSSDNITYNNISGATSATYAATQTTATYYSRTTTCTNSGLSSNSAFLYVTMSPLINCYCVGNYDNPCDDDYISNVTFGTINNTTLCTGTLPTNRTPYSSPNPTFLRVSSYPLSVTIDGGFDEGIRAWIDYDHSLTFIAGESILVSTQTGSPLTVTSSVTIPLTAQLGQTVLRVRCRYADNVGGGAACANYTPDEYGETEDYLITIADPPACGGIVTGGSTLTSSSFICAPSTVQLSLNGQTVASGLTYQWQSSPNNGIYTNISGATTLNYSPTVSVTTWYRCTITCTASAASANSVPVEVRVKPAFMCSYCSVTGTDCSLDDMITNVTLSSINNNSTCSPNGYTDYSSVSNIPLLEPGTTYPMSVTVGPGGTEYVGVWIDYNHSGVFEASEFTALGSGNGIPVNGNISIPLIPPAFGITTMRVRVRFSTALTGANACNVYTFGETEDYTVEIAPSKCLVAPTSPTNGGAGCANLTGTILSWPALAGATQYDVYFGTSNPATFKVSDNQTALSYNAGQLTAGTTYYWSVVPQITGATTCNTWSFTVNPVPVPLVSTPFAVCEFGDLTLFASNDAPPVPFQDPNLDTYSWTTNAANLFTSSAQGPNVTSSATTAQDAGTYTVILTNQFGCTATDSIVVSVITAPVMTATVTGVGCTGQCNGSVQVSATGGAGNYTYSDVSFTNSNTDGDFSLNQANGPIAICAGAYSIVVSDALTCSRTQSFNVTTISTAAPTASVLLPPIVNLPQFACNGTAVSNINVPAVANATYYIWDAPTNTVFANGQSIDTNSTPSANITFGPLFAANSGYYIGVQAANGCGPSIRKVQWVRGTLSVPSFTGPSIICTGTGPQTYTMTNAPIAGAQNYTWTGPTGSTINGSPSPLLNTSATSISLDVSGVSGGFTSGNICVQANAACITTAPKCIAISRVPNNLGVVSGPASVCPTPGPITHTYTVPNPGVTGGSYNWVLPGNTSGISNTNSINLAFNAGFTGGTLSVSYTNVCGQTSAVRTKSITIGSPSVPASITTPTTTGLCGISASFTAVPSQAGATFNWTFPTGSTPATATGTTATSTMPASYTQGQVCVTASNACGTSSPARCITVKGIPATPGATTPPSPWCAPTGGIQFTGNTGNLGGTYNLNWVVVPASSVSNPIGANTNIYTVDWDSAGAASVNLTASNACGSTTRTFAVNVPGCVRMGEVAPEVTATDYSFAINPNPATTVINYEFTASAANTTVINILDISGRVVMTTAVKTSEGFNSGQIDISQLAKGVYSLRAKSTDGTSVVKVVVE